VISVPARAGWCYFAHDFHPAFSPIFLVFRSRFFCCVWLLVCAAIFCGCGDNKKTSATAGNGPLIVGMELSFPPFEMLDENHQPAGISVDLARALAADLHRELRIENLPFDTLITSLKTGRIDLIISSMTVRPDRAESIDFSEPYVHTGIALLVRADSDIQTAADLDQPGRRIVVKSGTTGFLYANEKLRRATVRTLPEEANCALEVSQGKADAFLYDPIAVYQLNKKYPQSTRALLTPIQREDWAIGIRKGNDTLRRQVNAFLEDFEAKRGMAALNEKFLRDDKEAYRRMGFPFLD